MFSFYAHLTKCISIADCRDDLGSMVSGDCVNDCQHDKVGVSVGGKMMTLARWPNEPVNVTAPGGYVTFISKKRQPGRDWQ